MCSECKTVVQRTPSEKRLREIILRFINPRLKSWVNKKKVKALNRFNGLP